MDKRVSSRAIIINNNQLLTLFRRKKLENGDIKEYYSLPGGGQELNETNEDTVIRELQEELGVTIKIFGYLGNYEDDKSINHLFHCSIIKGTPKLGGEELMRMSNDNYYEPKFVNMSDINNIDINYKDKINNANCKKYI